MTTEQSNSNEQESTNKKSVSPDSIGINKALKDNKKLDAPNTTIDELEQNMEKTDFGHFINKNKNPIMILGVLIVILAATFSYFKAQSEKKSIALLNSVYDFEKNYANPYFTSVAPKSPDENKEKKEENVTKVSFDELIASYEKLPSEQKYSTSMLLTNLKISSELEKLGKTKESLDFLKTLNKNTEKNTYQSFMVGLKLAATLEDNNEFQESINVLNGLISSKIKVLEAKNYLDLGRLYLKLSDKDNAKKNFDYVISKFPNDENANLAKLYLSNL